MRARQVAQQRRQALREGRLDALNAPMRAGGAGLVRSSMVVSGTITVPTLFFTYSGVPAPFDTAQYRAVLFETTPPSPYGFQNPYTLRTFYDQMSNSLLDMQGRVMGWVTLPNTENSYTGNPGSCSGNPFGTTNCNGLFSNAAITSMQNGMRAALQSVDTGATGINFALFDNDGPDLIPNTADDDGYVDIMMFAHATQDGSCGGATNNHIWAHRFVLGATGVYVTNDASNSGDVPFVRVDDYFAQSAVGGTGSCDPLQIMPIGTAAHEFGHALGLPDLYDTSGPTEGIGRWGLMGSGNFSRPISPARMEAWSLNEMGWVTVANADTTGTYTFGSAPTADTAFLVNVSGANPRNERFLIENRQAVLADTALLLHACVVWHQNQTPPPCPGGLLIWHIDGTKISQPGNSVNVGSIHGLKLEEADGARDLWCPGATPFACNRGDAGDQFPGQTSNTQFGFRTNPAALKNSDSSFVGFAIDQVTQVVPDDRMSFRLRFGALTVVRASDTTASIRFDAGTFQVFRDLLEQGSSHTVDFTDGQMSPNGRTRFHFVSWSDGGAQNHTIVGSLAGGTLTATLGRDFLLMANWGPGGSVTADTAINLVAGDFIPEGRTVTLTATPDAGQQFGGWTGDTVTTNAVVSLPMGRPYTVFATFGSLAISSATTRPSGVMGAGYADTLRVTGGTGTNSWAVTGGALPLGLTLDGPTGVVSGFPRETGNFSYTATVTSGAQSQNRTFTFSVTAPTLATAAVTTQLLGPTAPLNADQVRYLDFLGNNNGSFDVGDFLAWVKLTGAPPSPAAAPSVARRKGGPQ